MRDLIQRLRDLYPLLAEVFKISGASGASLGVLHGGEIIYTENFGFRDFESKIAPDENTLYYIASVSKAVTAAGVGILVDEGKLRWNDIISEVLPDFQHQNSHVRQHVTIADILSHRTGLAPKLSVWMGDHSRMLVKPPDFTKTTTTLESTTEIGTAFSTNNWLYGIAAQIIERFSQQSFSDFIENKLFLPLGLTNTRVRRVTSEENFAEPYMYDEDTPYRVLRPPIEVGGCMEGAVGVKTSVVDLLTYYNSLIKAANDQGSHNRTFTPGSPFRQVTKLFEPHIVINDLPKSYANTTYSLGWAQARLPSALGSLSDNMFQVKQMPVIGEGSEATPLIHCHAGSLLGYLSSAMLFPETESAIVVLVNTLANQDFADWASQMLTEALFNFSSKHDFVSLAKEAAAAYSMQFPNMHAELEKERIPGTPMKPRRHYVGRYFNSVDTFYLDVFEESGSLYLAFAGRRDDKHKLDHYHYDIFSWEMSYADCKKFEAWPAPAKELYLLEFQHGQEHYLMDAIIWRHDPAVPEGEVYVRKDIVPTLEESQGSQKPLYRL